MESVYEITHWLRQGSGGMQSSRGTESLTLGVSQEARRQTRKRAHADSARSALMSVLFKWYTSVLVGWVNFEHMQALLTNILQWRYWESQVRTAFMASLDVKTALGVAKPSVVSKCFTHTGTLWRVAKIRIVKSRGEVENQGWEKETTSTSSEA